MAGIIDGVWHAAHEIDPDTADPLSNWITHDASPGPTGRGGFLAEAGRYQLYLAHGCPSCHKVSIARQLFGLEAMFAVTFVDVIKRSDGWRLSPGADTIFGASSLHHMMICAEGNLTAKATVPQLLDKNSKRLVSDSSADMVRMMDQISAAQRPGHCSLWPEPTTDTIDELCSWISAEISSRVYQVLFSTQPKDKEHHVHCVKEALAILDERLAQTRFLHGEAITASDIWLFPTLLRFDSVYSEIFGLDFKLGAFSNLGPYVHDLWSLKAFAMTSDLKRINDHYYLSLIHGPNGTFEPGLGKSPASATRFDLSHPNIRASKCFSAA